MFNSSDPSWGLLRVCVTRLRAPGCGWGVVVVSAAALLVLAALGLALALILLRESAPQKRIHLNWWHDFQHISSCTVFKWYKVILFASPLHSYVWFQSCVSDVATKGQDLEDQFLSTRSPDLLSAVDVSPNSPTTSANRGQVESTASSQPAKIPPSEMSKTSWHPQIPVFWLSGLLLTILSVCQDVEQFWLT